MKKILTILVAMMLLSCTTWAKGTQEQDYSFNGYKMAIEKNLGVSLDKNQIDVATITYTWYNTKWNSEWEKSKFDYAVEQGSKNCQNKIMLGAAKLGQFGQKTLKALIVSAGEAAEAFDNWLNRQSAKY